MKLNAVRAAFPRTLPVLAGYVVLGMAFGLLFQSIGFGPFWALAMSVIVFAGSAQFLGVGLIAAGSSLSQVAILTFLLNFRHFFYGISLLERYQHAGIRKPYLIFALSDETYALLTSGYLPEGVDPVDYSFAISLLDQSYWVIGSVIGSTVGTLIEFNTTGVDFAMTALFVVIAVEQWKSASSHAPALIGLCCGMIALLVFGPEYFLIPSLIAIVALLLVARAKLERGKEGAVSPP